MSDYARRRLACDLIDVSRLLKVAARSRFSSEFPEAHAAIKRAIERGNAADDDRMESTLDIAAIMLNTLKMTRERTMGFDPDLVLIDDIMRYADELEKAGTAIERELATAPPSPPVLPAAETESVSPFDRFGTKTRKFLNYLWDRGNKPRRSIADVMKHLGYGISSPKAVRAFNQLKNRAINELSMMSEKPRYTIDTHTTHKRNDTISLAELPS